MVNAMTRVNSEGEKISNMAEGSNGTGEVKARTAKIDMPYFVRQLRAMVAGEPKAFAYEIGVTLSGMYNYLQGVRPPCTWVMFRICLYTGKPIEFFLRPTVATADVEKRQAVA